MIRSKKGVDVLIFTPLSIEFATVKEILTDGYDWIDPETGWAYQIGTVQQGEGVLKIAVIESGRGSTETHIAVAAGVDTFKPAVAILFGTAGGRKRTKIGDVLIGSSGRNYEQGKHAPEGFRGMPLSLPASHRLVQLAKKTDRDKVWKSQLANALTTEPMAYEGAIVSGDKVLDNPRHELNKLLREQHYASIGLEMEAYAFLRTVHQRPGTEAINIRGVSDLLAGKTEANAQGSRELALKNAASFLKAFLINLEAPYILPEKSSNRELAGGTVLLLMGAFIASYLLFAPASAPGKNIPPDPVVQGVSTPPDETAPLVYEPPVAVAGTTENETKTSDPLGRKSVTNLPTPSPSSPVTDEEKVAKGTKVPKAEITEQEGLGEEETVSEVILPADATATVLTEPALPEPAALHVFRLDVFNADEDQEFFSSVEVDGKLIEPKEGVLLELPAGEYILKLYVNNKQYEREILVTPNGRNSLYETFK